MPSTVTLTSARTGRTYRADAELYARYQQGDRWWLTKPGEQRSSQHLRELKHLKRVNCNRGWFSCDDPYTGRVDPFDLDFSLNVPGGPVYLAVGVLAVAGLIAKRIRGSRANATQLWGRYQGGAWELIDESDADNPIEFLLVQYKQAFGAGWEFQVR